MRTCATPVGREASPEIADAIRINQEVLTAIEGGQVDYGPGQTFIRGFMRSYARFLDMDPQALQERLNAIPFHQLLVHLLELFHQLGPN